MLSKTCQGRRCASKRRNKLQAPNICRAEQFVGCMRKRVEELMPSLVH